MVSSISNPPLPQASPSDALRQVKSNITSNDPQTKSGTISSNEFKVVENTNTTEVKPALTQNNLNTQTASPLRGSTLDISV